MTSTSRTSSVSFDSKVHILQPQSRERYFLDDMGGKIEVEEKRHDGIEELMNLEPYF